MKPISKAAIKESRIYFPNLDALRFIAASLVVIFHVEWKKKHFGLYNYLDHYFFHTIGEVAVTIFFVISGFIITYLLLAEYVATNRIDIPKFYLRRILRIWPLYYFIILLGVLILQHIPQLYIPEKSLLWSQLDFTAMLLFLFFLSNVVIVLYGNIPYIDQTWSIGVEEQYYIIWPLLIRMFGKYKYFFMIFILMTIGLTNMFFTEKFLAVTAFSTTTKQHIKDALFLTRFSCMGIGGFGAYLYFYKERHAAFLQLILHKTNQVVLYITVIICLSMGVSNLVVGIFLTSTMFIWLFGQKKSMALLIGSVSIGMLLFLVLVARVRVSSIGTYFTHEILSVLFCLILLNLANTNTSLINTSNKILLYLGKISYGIYMYHNIFVVVSIYLITKVIRPLHYINILIYCFTFILTILVSAVSYEFFEKHFLRLKKKVTIIKSGAQIE